MIGRACHARCTERWHLLQCNQHRLVSCAGFHLDVPAFEAMFSGEALLIAPTKAAPHVKQSCYRFLNRDQVVHALGWSLLAHFMLGRQHMACVWARARPKHSCIRLRGNVNANRPAAQPMPRVDTLRTAYDPDLSKTLSMPEYIGMTLFLSSATSAFQARPLTPLIPSPCLLPA